MDDINDGGDYMSIYPNLETIKTTAIDGRISVIIGFKKRPGRTDIDMIVGHRGEIKYVYNLINAIAVTIPEKAIEAIKRNPNVEYVEIDERVVAFQKMVTLQQTIPWGISKINAPAVQAGGNKGIGIKISVIDTGIDYNHPDLSGNYKGGYNFVYNNPDAKDDNGHGTHVAGIIGAIDNNIGVVGVAPESYLYSVKVLDSLGGGYISDVVAGIQWSVDNKIQIINMSLGTSVVSKAMGKACDNAYNRGLLLVAAAGNNGNVAGTGNNIDYPARYNSVIAVVAVDTNNTRPLWSSTGRNAELAAPGVNIYSTLTGGVYGNLSGTSMACPHVVGTAALVMKAHPEFSNVQTRVRMQLTTEDIGGAGKDNLYGYGLINAYKAVTF